MNPDDPQDLTLQAHFSAMRAADVERAPSFAAMMTHARAIAMQPTSSAPSFALPPATRPSMAWWAWSTPLIVAAGLAVLLLRSPNTADEEFEQLVSAWSRSNVTLRSPTDRLLTIPGSEYLRTTPAVGIPHGSSRTRSPS